MTDLRKPKRANGTGTIVQEGKRFALYMRIHGKKKYMGSFATEADAETHMNTILVASGGGVGCPTWREMGQAYLAHIKPRLKSYKMYSDTFHSVIQDAPFIDEPMDVTERPTLVKWADELPLKKKKRSVLKHGKRQTITLKETIGHAHAINSVAVLRAIWKYACDLDHLKLGDGLAAELHVPQDRTKNKGKGSRMPVLTLPEIELLLTCQTCAHGDPARAGDPDLLASCPHMPYENRVVFCIEIHQAPRQGELQGMNWEACDWADHGWHIRQNRDTSTKGRKDTWQAWLPRTKRYLRKWWELAGRPESGIMFPSRRVRPKQMGARRAFVAAQPEHLSASEVVALATAAGLDLKEQTVHAYRSANRKAGEQRAQVRYAQGFDWGWSGTMSTTRGYRPGWPERVGIKTRITFHQLRDTCASHLLSGSWGRKWDPKDVSVHLTHETVAITEKRYAHLLKDAKVRVAALTETDPSKRAVEGIWKVGSEADLAKYAETLAPEPGLEPGTTRLTVDSLSSKSERLDESSYQIPSTTIAAAQKLLAAAAGGQPLTAVALQLAGEILEASEREKRDDPAPQKGLRLVKGGTRKVTPFNPE